MDEFMIFPVWIHAQIFLTIRVLLPSNLTSLFKDFLCFCSKDVVVCMSYVRFAFLGTKFRKTVKQGGQRQIHDNVSSLGWPYVHAWLGLLHWQAPCLFLHLSSYNPYKKGLYNFSDWIFLSYNNQNSPLFLDSLCLLNNCVYWTTSVTPHKVCRTYHS